MALLVTSSADVCAACRDDHEGLGHVINRVNVNKKDADGCTLLHYASDRGHVDCCRFLIDHGASVNVQGYQGVTPLYRASDRGHVDCCKLLLENGASIDVQDNTGETSLYTACCKGHIDCCKLLLKKGASIDIPCETGYTPLQVASQKGHVDCCCCLIENGASINIHKKNISTPLSLACEGGHIKCVEVLLEKGADPSLADSVRNGPIEIARSKGHLDIVRILEKYKANQAEGNKQVVADTAKVSTSASAPISKLKKLKNVFKKSPRPSTSPVETVICTNTTLCRLFIQSLDLKDAYFNSQYDVCFCESCHRERGDNLYYTRGQPPKDYGLPIGWFKFGLIAPAKAAGKDAFYKWHVAFHGTRVDCVGQILKIGDLPMPGDFTPTGACLRPPPNHFDADNPKMMPPAGHDVSKIYLSPSIRYSGLEVYAPKSTYKDPRTGRIYNARVAFQVRIAPGTYDVGDQTIGAHAPIDPRIPNSELEWSTKRRGVTILVGLLVKMESPMAGPSLLDKGSLGPTLPPNLKF